MRASWREAIAETRRRLELGARKNKLDEDGPHVPKGLLTVDAKRMRGAANPASNASSAIVLVRFVDGPFGGMSMLFANPEFAMTLGDRDAELVYVRRTVDPSANGVDPSVAYYATSNVGR
jgi:hypothetical protein